jgi:hypothetical protein
MSPISAVSDVPARPVKEQGRHHGAEFAHQAQRNQQAERLGRAVALQRVIHLQPQHEADEQPRHADDRERVVAQEMDLVAHEAEATHDLRARTQETHEKLGAIAEICEQWLRTAKPTSAGFHQLMNALLRHCRSRLRC